jgi:uncharacterized protein
MEPTLEAGLARLFGTSARDRRDTDTDTGGAGAAGGAGAGAAGARGAAGAPGAASEGGTADATGMTALAAEARAVYERAIAAQKAGDWAEYGEEIRRLGEILAKMRQ